MKTYALVQFGIVSEIIQPVTDADGTEIAIENLYTPEVVAMLVDVTDVTPMPSARDSYDGTTFTAYVTPIESVASVTARNTALQQGKLTSAVQAMTPLLIALQLGSATDAQKASAAAWQKYYADVQAVDLTLTLPVWPTAPGA